MQLNYISLEAWEKLEGKYSSAYYFLLRESLKGEKKGLTNELNYLDVTSPRATWINSRLKDLENY